MCRTEALIAIATVKSKTPRVVIMRPKINTFWGSDQRGVTLIMVAAVLAILAALGTGFYTMMLMATKSATRYSDSVRAELMAKAGVEFAIAGLRQQAYKKTEDPTDPWFMVNYLNGGKKGISFPDNKVLHDGVDDDNDGIADNVDEINTNVAGNLPFSRTLGSSAAVNSDRFTLNISDAASKININACDNLGVLLDNLCRIIGPPLVAADLDAIQPRRWAMEMFSNADPEYQFYAPGNGNNALDIAANQDLYYWLYDEGGAHLANGSGRPKRFPDGTAVYGDGYAIAGWRGLHGRFPSINDVKNALTYVERSSPPDGVANDPLERLEIEVKFQAIRDYITIESWVDTNTVCVGKFEWVSSDTGSGGEYPAYSIAIDRDKSWVPSAPGDAKAFKSNPNSFVNVRGSLIGSYLSIINGHGSGQLRIIVDNGVDWIRVEPGFVVEPGPISSYMIVGRDPASYMDSYGSLVGTLPDPLTMDTHVFPQTDANGNLIANINVDYVLHPLCIHRAPVNINTASEKVLAALFMGINVQHGHPTSIGTDVDLALTAAAWKIQVDPDRMEPFVLTPKGLKRTPVSTGKPLLDRPVPWNSPTQDPQFAYLNNYNSLGIPNFVVVNNMTCNEAHELAYRVIVARTKTLGLPIGTPDPDPMTADPGDGSVTPYNAKFDGFNKGPFRSWDDFYFRVVKPWDDIRSGYFLNGKATIPNSGVTGITTGLGKSSVARLIMVNFNPNTDILKFNPNIEWVDRWGRNFTDEEGVMAYTDDAPDQAGVKWSNPAVANPLKSTSQPIFTQAQVSNQNRGTQVLAQDWLNQNDPNSGTYVIRSYRFRSDEMIDKTDLNRSTTEFAFESRGIYEIQSIGQIITKDGTVQAERKIEALVKLYDVWRETTQRQFVQGVISPGPGLINSWSASASDIAGMGPKGSSHSGTIARDSVNPGSRLPLTTQPEPLVPIQYRIDNTLATFGGAGKGLANTEMVDPNRVIRDQYGDPKPDPTVPDVVANRILPASYDGQIVLASNTSAFDPVGDGDTFLASFNGDMDTDTCLGNGREQAKMPHVETPAKFQNQGYRFRVVDTCGLLGILNDPLIDIDTDLPANPNGFTWPAYDSNWGGWTPLPSAKGPPAVYHFPILSYALGGLKPANYWENVSTRMGDLRTDGVYLGGPGVCGNDATVKYMFGDGITTANDSWVPGKAKLNFNPGSPDGNLVTMWFKSTWHHNDKRTHPFFDASNPGAFQGGTACRACYLKKFGALVWALGWGSDSYVSGNRSRTDDLYFTLEGNIGPAQNDGDRDKDLLTQLHGGFNWVPSNMSYGPKKLTGSQPYAPWNGTRPESPSFRVQPFRWQFTGMRWRYNSPGLQGAGGHWRTDGQDPVNKSLIGSVARPIMDTQIYPEPLGTLGNNSLLYNGYWSSIPNTDSGYYYPCDIGDTGLVNCNGSSTTPGSGFGSTGQPVKWIWADPSGTEDPRAKIFGVNNLNQDLYTWIYQHLPADGTYAVIDELKISNKEKLLNSVNNPKLAGGAPFPYPKANTPDWGVDSNNAAHEMQAHDRGIREQTLSRYYLPPNPADPSQCPIFTSQTMLQSLKGFTTTAATPEYVTLARVTWTVFTPRFLHENKLPTVSRTEQRRGIATPIKFKGPFDYDKYNEVYSAIPLAGNQGQIFPFGVDRPTPKDYAFTDPNAQSHYTQGVEVELLNRSTNGPIAGSMESPPNSGQFIDVPTGTFVNPDIVNRFLNAAGVPVPEARISTSDLQYRVRFKYPVDQLVDLNAGLPDQNNIFCVNPATQYLLDTPVFDDISITYFIKPRILYYREVTE